MGKSRARRKPSLNKHIAAAEVIGFDGERPQFVPARDIMGTGRRAKVDGPQNINVDRLEWLLAKKHIEPHHHQAGRKLQRLYETAEISVGVKLVGAGGAGVASSSLSDAQCDAMHEVNRVKAAMSPINFRLVELVVIERFKVEDATKKLGLGSRSATSSLVLALDSLARHFRLC